MKAKIFFIFNVVICCLMLGACNTLHGLGKDIRIGGGAATIRQYLEAGLIDELHLAVSPVLLGAGESPVNGLDLPTLGYTVAESKQGETAMHVFIHKTP